MRWPALDTLPEINAKTFEPYGSCIYCGATEQLSKEHIVPHGLNGSFVLPQASCRACAAVTSQFERVTLRGPMWPVRAHLQLKSRRANLAPKAAKLTVIRGDEVEEVHLPLKDHPLVLDFPLFVAPSIFTGQNVVGITLRGHASYTFGKRLKDVMRDHGADNIKLSQDYDFVPFAQMLGKIAWSMAAAERRLDRIDKEDCLLSSLVYDANDIGRWVGTEDGPFPVERRGVLHMIVPAEMNGYLIYRIQLFADRATPLYLVVVGKLR